MIETRIEAANEKLQEADGVTRTINDAGKSIGALIIACGYLLEVIEDQNERIERLEDILQGQLERRRR